MKNLTGCTYNGIKLSCKIDSEKPEVAVEHDERIRFLFNPDFPQDAKALFEALCNVWEIVIDE